MGLRYNAVFLALLKKAGNCTVYMGFLYILVLITLCMSFFVDFFNSVSIDTGFIGFICLVFGIVILCIAGFCVDVIETEIVFLVIRDKIIKATIV